MLANTLTLGCPCQAVGNSYRVGGRNRGLRMRSKWLLLLGIIVVAVTSSTLGLRGQTTSAPVDAVQALVGRLNVESYKASIKGLTQFGDRRQGTDRNRAAVDWIETQLKSYGCSTERFSYVYTPAPPAAPAAAAPRREPT